MRPTGVWMVSMDQDDAFRGQHLLQLGTRAGYSTVMSRVSCSRAVCCAARLEGTDSFTTDLFHPMIVEGFYLDKTEPAAREQSRRRQESAKRGSSTTSDKPTIQQQVQRRVRRTLLPGRPMKRTESQSLVRGRPRRPRTGLSDQ